MIDRESKTELTYDLAHAKVSKSDGYFTPKKVSIPTNKYRRPKISDEVIFRNIDMKKKVSTIWNPKYNEIIVSCTKNLYVFTETPVESDN